MQLREKQKVRRIYGILERQFRRYYRDALKRTGLTGENLLSTLERRLDNVIYRLGFAESRAQARQLVQHGHFEVNGRRTNIPSYLVRLGERIEVREGSRTRVYFKEVPELMAERLMPQWLERDPARLVGTVVRIPERADIEMPINEQLIVEYYSR
jgi:small subunit ribosomal protein S4